MSMRRLTRILIVLGLLVVGGTVGYTIIEGWRPLDSLYMTVITLTAVGFSEAHPLSPAGKVFTMILILAGVGSVAWLLSNLFDLILSSKFRYLRKQRWRLRMIEQLKNHVIVCGYGRMGRYVASHLKKQGVDVLVVDLEESTIHACEREGIHAFVGDATEDETLNRAGIERARSLIAALNSDAANVFVVLTARGLHPDLHIISRASRDESEPKLRKAGANRVILPYALSGQRMASLVVQPGVVDFLDVVMHSGEFEYALSEIAVVEGSPLAGESLADLRMRQTHGVTVLGVYTPGEELLSQPQPADKLETGSRIIVMGTTSDLADFRQASQ